MSVVNYHFYRYKEGDFTLLLEWLKAFRGRYQYATKERVREYAHVSTIIDFEEVGRLMKIVDQIVEETRNESSDRKMQEMKIARFLSTLNERTQEELCNAQIFLDLLLEATHQGIRSLFNIESEVAILFHENDIYVKFFVDDHLFSITKGNIDDHFEDLWYDGRVDRPETISEEEWDRRYDIVCALENKMNWRRDVIFPILDESDAISIVFRQFEE